MYISAFQKKGQTPTERVRVNEFVVHNDIQNGRIFFLLEIKFCFIDLIYASSFNFILTQAESSRNINRMQNQNSIITGHGLNKE
jgi:hypothetical protein